MAESADPKRVEEGLGHTPLVHEEYIHHKDDGDDDRRKTNASVFQPNDESVEVLQLQQKSKRVAALDAFRGLTIVVSASTFLYCLYKLY